MRNDTKSGLPDPDVLGPHPSREDTMRFVQAFFDALDQQAAIRSPPGNAAATPPSGAADLATQRRSADPQR